MSTLTLSLYHTHTLLYLSPSLSRSLTLSGPNQIWNPIRAGQNFFSPKSWLRSKILLNTGKTAKSCSNKKVSTYFLIRFFSFSSTSLLKKILIFAWFWKKWLEAKCRIIRIDIYLELMSSFRAETNLCRSLTKQVFQFRSNWINLTWSRISWKFVRIP